VNTKKVLRNTGLTAALLVGGAFGYRPLVRLVTADPFKHLRTGETSGVGIKMPDVHLWEYDGDRLIAEAQVDEIDVRQDRQFFDLSRVYNGVYYGDKGNIDFSADSATWNAAALTLDVTSGAHVKSKDMDIRMPSFVFDDRASLLTVPGEIKGRLMDGDASAANLRYAVGTGSIHAGPISWTGMVRTPIQGDQDPKSKWHFKADDLDHEKDKEVWKNAEATDGDIVVKAPEIDRDPRTDVITAIGDVLYFSAKADMACDKAVIYRKEKRAVMTGHVRMMIKPKDQMEHPVETEVKAPVVPVVPAAVAKDRPKAQPDETDEQKQAEDEVRSGNTTRRYPIAVKADAVEYWYGKGNRHAIINGSPEAHQDLQPGFWRNITAMKGLYDGEKEELTLQSSKDGVAEVHMTTSIGDDVLCGGIIASTKEDEDRYHLIKPIDGTVVDVHGEAPTDKDKGGGTQTGTSTGGGAGGSTSGGSTGGTANGGSTGGKTTGG
jgi:hypothetical protein